MESEQVEARAEVTKNLAQALLKLGERVDTMEAKVREFFIHF